MFSAQFSLTEWPKSIPGHQATHHLHLFLYFPPLQIQTYIKTAGSVDLEKFNIEQTKGQKIQSIKLKYMPYINIIGRG